MICVDRGHPIGDVVRVARNGAPLSLSEAARLRLVRSRLLLEDLMARGEPMYGVTTGVGALSATPVAPEEAARLSENIVLSHACGVGEPLFPDQVRAIVFCAILNYCQGYSGMRVETVERLVDMLNLGVTPWVPSQGGMGSLTHMAHVGCALIGRGCVHQDGRLIPVTESRLRAWRLDAKEGLSLVNGTPSKSGLASLVVHDARRLACLADAAGAMSFEALRGTVHAFDPRVHAARGHAGQQRVADNLRRLLAESEIAERYKDHRLQDALSLRAMPQVHGACRDQIEHAARVLEVELNAATDNPLIFEASPEERAGGRVAVPISANNAHGEPLALVLDALCMAVAELASISERRIDRMLNHHVSELPPFLTDRPGVCSGLMIPQYVAASLVAENKALCHPMSVDSIPTTSLQEDHWSMATPAALKAARVVANAQKVLAVELLVGAQALEFHRPARAGRGTEFIYACVRSRVARLEEDRELYPDLHTVIAEVERCAWVEAVEAAVGAL